MAKILTHPFLHLEIGQHERRVRRRGSAFRATSIADVRDDLGRRAASRRDALVMRDASSTKAR